MAQIRSNRSTYSSKGRPGLRDARNWATAQMRAATYSRQGFWRLVLSIVMLFTFIIVGALWLGGYFPDVRKLGQDFTRSRLVSMGFVVERVDVVGEGQIREDDVRLALNIQPGTFLFETDMIEAQKRVESLSWVERAIVRRLWPDRIVVQIMERRPYALWQYKGDVKLVDVEGHVITDADIGRFTDLPLVVGPQAAENMKETYELVLDYPLISKRVYAMVQLPSGRWDLRLDNDMVVQLPEENAARALQRLSYLQQNKQILERNIAVIDLRLADRLTLAARGEPA